MVSSNIRCTQFEHAIACMEAKKRGIATNYIQTTDLLERGIEDIESRIGGIKSRVKKDLLRQQCKHLGDLSIRLDEEYETNIDECDKIIEKHEISIGELRETIKVENSSLDFNIDCLRKYKENPGTYNMSQVLENIVNALEIIKDNKKNKKSTSFA